LNIKKQPIQKKEIAPGKETDNV